MAKSDGFRPVAIPMPKHEKKMVAHRGSGLASNIAQPSDSQGPMLKQTEVVDLRNMGLV